MEDGRPSAPVETLENRVLRASIPHLQEAFCPDFNLHYEREPNLTNCTFDGDFITYEPLHDTPDDPVVRGIDKQKTRDTNTLHLRGPCYQKSNLMKWLVKSKLKSQGNDFQVPDPNTKENVCLKNTRQQALTKLANVDNTFETWLQETGETVVSPSYPSEISEDERSENEESGNEVSGDEDPISETDEDDEFEGPHAGVPQDPPSLEWQRDRVAMNVEDYRNILREARESQQRERRRYEQLRSQTTSPEALLRIRNDHVEHMGRMRHAEARLVNIINEAIARRNGIEEAIAQRDETEREAETDRRVRRRT
jgi:hypothetical protein